MIPQLERFCKKKILVVGDVMLDHYLHGLAERISPEAPVPVVLEEYHTYALGGAGNVANNISTLGGTPSLLGLIGGDQEGKIIKELASQVGIHSLLVEGYQRTETKLRILASGQQLLRVDSPVKPLRPGLSRELLELVGSEPFQAVVFSDYGKGVLNSEVVGGLRGLGNLMVADPKPRNMPLFSGCFAITPNLKEGKDFLEARGEVSPPEVAKALGKELNTRVVLTCGSGGIYLWDPDGRSGHIPPHTVEAKDPTGAGDVVTAIVSLGLASGMTLWESCLLANRGAALSVTKLGTYSIMREELIQSLRTTPLSPVF